MLANSLAFDAFADETKPFIPPFFFSANLMVDMIVVVEFHSVGGNLKKTLHSVVLRTR